MTFSKSDDTKQSFISRDVSNYFYWRMKMCLPFIMVEVMEETFMMQRVLSLGGDLAWQYS